MNERLEQELSGLKSMVAQDWGADTGLDPSDPEDLCIVVARAKAIIEATGFTAQKRERQELGRLFEILYSELDIGELSSPKCFDVKSALRVAIMRLKRKTDPAWMLEELDREVAQ